MTQADYIISRAKESLPSHLANAPWRILGHGTGLLSTQDELNAYLAAYGEMHKVKCNAAIQNFPFDKLPQRIHLVDWGCGQGLGALCFLDNLYVRGLVGRVKKITLIEPSPAALKRAGLNLSKAMENYDAAIDTVECYLPANTDSANSLSALQMNLPGTVHIFSNILDIPSVNLRKTAQIIEEGRGIQFVMCTSPVNDNSPRLDEFAQYFTSTEVFSDLCDRDYGYTSDTYHKFGCKTKCFFFNSTESSLYTDVREGTYSEDGAYDDYDLQAMVRSGSLTESLFKAYTVLSSCLGRNDRIFLKPDLNGETPDIIVIRPGKGVLVLNVFDEDMNSCMFDDGAFLVNGIPSASPLARAFGYRDSIIQQHSTEILKKTVTDKSAWYIVRPAVWFPQGSRMQIESLFVNQLKKDGKTPRNVISGVITLSADEIDAQNIWQILDMQFNKKSFTEKACNQLISLLKSQWHCYIEGDNEIRLTQRQSQLAKSFKGRVLRVKGVAGSGKTQVLASTAVNCQLRTGRKVLILTYNITLVNYIRYRIGQIPADFPWKKFTITNYHSFFTSQAKNQDLKLNLSSYDDPDFFAGVTNQLPKFSAILIDEAQDYKRNWFKILFDSFLEDDGEVVIFGDKNQDVYRRRDFDSIPNVRGHVWGPWTGLNIGHRVNNQAILDLAREFQQAYFQDPEEFGDARELTFGGGTRYCSVPSNTNPQEIVHRILDYVREEGIDLSQTVILSQTTDILREVDYSYRTMTNVACMTTFETKEVFNALLKSSDGKVNSRFKEDLDKIRTNKKAHFTMMSQSPKISTIYSYKGWEAPCVILLILPDPGHSDALENRPELIYTAITRAKDYLFVINLDNKTYHNFFENQIG